MTHPSRAREGPVAGPPPSKKTLTFVSQMRYKYSMSSSMLHVRMDDDTKAQGNAVLEAIGLSASDAVRLLYRRLAADQAFPLELKVPNAETRAAMREANDIIRARKARIDSGEELIASLDG